MNSLDKNTPEARLLFAIVVQSIRDLVLEDEPDRKSAVEFLCSADSEELLLWFNVPVPKVRDFAYRCKDPAFRKENKHKFTCLSLGRYGGYSDEENEY